jgi:integrase/recombinase XerD
MRENFADLLFAFKEHLKVQNYSRASIDSYCYNLQRFFLHLEGKQITDIRQVSRQILKDYQLDITKRYGSGTVSIMIRSVKRFFEYLEKTNQILLNPAEYLREPKKESRLPRVVLSNDEALKILDQPNLSTFNGIRDRTILEVFYSTGVRLEELRSLTIYDSDLKGGFLRVNKGKFAKDRVIPLGKHAVRFLKEYVTHVRPGHTKNNKAIRNLFVNHSGRILSRPVIEILVRKYARAAGIRKKVTPHSFRHSFATELVKNGADITAVQKMLGHSRLSVTQLYTKVAGVEVKRTHAKHHPREKDKAEREEAHVTIDGIGNRR